MLYREIIAVCSQIHTKHINTAVWAERGIVNVKAAGPYVQHPVGCIVMLCRPLMSESYRSAYDTVGHELTLAIAPLLSRPTESDIKKRSRNSVNS